MIDKTLLSAAEFLALPESNLPTELIHGEVIMSPAPIPAHQQACRRVYLLLSRLVKNGQLFFSPIDVYLDDENVVQPDVLWIAEGGRCQLEPKFLRGAPDLVVEVHSTRTAHLDKGTKFDLYEQHGVSEYWMIDLEHLLIEVWERADETFKRVGVFGAEDSFASPLLEQSMIVKELLP